MDIDEEFKALRLPKAKRSLAWEARAKIIWGQPRDEVQTWLEDYGIDAYAAEQIVAIAVRERGLAIRVKGIRDLVLGIPICVAGAGAGIAVAIVANYRWVAMSIRGIAALLTISIVTFFFGAYLTWRGLVRVIGGARVHGAVSDVEG
jgi:hypothetical protein